MQRNGVILYFVFSSFYFINMSQTYTMKLHLTFHQHIAEIMTEFTFLGEQFL